MLCRDRSVGVEASTVGQDLNHSAEQPTCLRQITAFSVSAVLSTIQHRTCVCVCGGSRPLRTGSPRCRGTQGDRGDDEDGVIFEGEGEGEGETDR